MIFILEYFQPNYTTSPYNLTSQKYFYPHNPPISHSDKYAPLQTSLYKPQTPQFQNLQKQNTEVNNKFSISDYPSSRLQPKYSFLNSPSPNIGNLENVAKKTALVGGTLGGAALLHALASSDFINSEDTTSETQPESQENLKNEISSTSNRASEKNEVSPKLLQPYPAQKSMDVSSNPNHMISGATPVPPSYVQHYPQNNLQSGNQSIMIPDRGGTPFGYHYTPNLGDSFNHVPNRRVFRIPGSIW